MQRMPAALPCGMPGIAEEIDKAIQHAPQPARHDIAGVGKGFGGLIRA